MASYYIAFFRLNILFIIFTFSYPWMVEKVSFWSQIFEMMISMDLHVLNLKIIMQFSLSLSLSLCVCVCVSVSVSMPVSRITPKQIIAEYAWIVWSYAAKSHDKLFIKAQNSTIRKILSMPWYIWNFHVYKEIKWFHLIPQFKFSFGHRKHVYQGLQEMLFG